MEQLSPPTPAFVGIGVAKDRLDVHVLPSREAFAVACDGPGLEALVDRLRAVAPVLIVLEATGGFEAAVVAALGRAGPAASWRSTRARCATSPRRSARWQRPTLDARVLAQFAERGAAGAVAPLPDAAARRWARW